MATKSEPPSVLVRHGSAYALKSPSLKIACVYRLDRPEPLPFANMATIRLYRMAAALARRGHEVDIVVGHHDERRALGTRLHEVPVRAVKWTDYQVVKTFFHRGFESLCGTGGGDHPFIISKLGSVVGSAPTEGVHFFGAERKRLYATQQEIARRSRVVTILTPRSIELWKREHGAKPQVLMVPTGVDAVIPPIRSNPYRKLGIEGPIALYAGHLYSATSQPSVNVMWQNKLNRIGAMLRRRGITLVAMGTGRTDLLDPEAVVFAGTMNADEVWDWQRHAQAGLVIALGDVQHNESSKIYYYLRTGLPVVCERSVPNSPIIEETGMGKLVDYDNLEAYADAVEAVVRNPPINPDIERYMVAHHSWDARAAMYDPVLAALG